MARDKPKTVGCRVTRETKEKFEKKLDELGLSQQEFLEKKVKEVIGDA